MLVRASSSVRAADNSQERIFHCNSGFLSIDSIDCVHRPDCWDTNDLVTLPTHSPVDLTPVLTPWTTCGATFSTLDAIAFPVAIPHCFTEPAIGFARGSGATDDTFITPSIASAKLGFDWRTHSHHFPISATFSVCPVFSITFCTTGDIAAHTGSIAVHTTSQAYDKGAVTSHFAVTLPASGSNHSFCNLSVVFSASCNLFHNPVASLVQNQGLYSIFEIVFSITSGLYHFWVRKFLAISFFLSNSDCHCVQIHCRYSFQLVNKLAPHCTHLYNRDWVGSCIPTPVTLLIHLLK